VFHPIARPATPRVLPTELLEARHLFSLNTCNGCHGAETATEFFHVGPRRAGQVAPLSKFLTGESGFQVKDPAEQMEEAHVKSRPFHDLPDRVKDLRGLVEIGSSYESARKRPNWVH
jgi:hypothetical protein